ncbi:MAG: hypothetical protein D6767_07965 [Candidatus Hydrogenedentota bacterium]|nr:MAG: hypothetical protein D6767_07965 [Candidatus Hydrogenedentota bacterium]
MNLPVDHSNPYDRVYENGNYRIVLAPAINVGSGLKFEWSDIVTIPTAENESPDNLNLSSLTFYVANGKFSDTDISKIQNQQTLAGSITAISYGSALTEFTAPHDGQKTLSLDPSNAYEVVLEASGTAGGKAILFHSNIVRWQP